MRGWLTMEAVPEGLESPQGLGATGSDEAQAMVLNTGANRVIVNCTRQWGTTTMAAARSVRMAERSPRRARGRFPCVRPH